MVEDFHTISSEYEQLCAIVPHMTQVQAASVISRLPVILFLGKKEKVKSEMKQEMGTMESMSEAPQVLETSQTSEAPQVPETSQTPEAPQVPEMSQTSEAP